MHARIVDFFKGWSEDTTRGDFESIFERFVMPTLIYVSDKVIVIRNREEFLDLFDRFRAELANAGLAGKHFRVNSIVKERPDGISVWATASHVTEAGTIKGLTDIKYFFRILEGELKIEMIEVANTSDLSANPFLAAVSEGQPPKRRRQM